MHIVFSDIDGTLLDHNTYSYEKSSRGMSILKEKNVPLIMVSSKTFDEMKILHKELGLDSCFVFENGGGIAYFNDGEYSFEIVGQDAGELFEMKELISSVMGCTLRFLPEMSIEEVVNFTGLPVERAKFAVMRKASLPFILLEEKKFDIKKLIEINELIKKNKLFITKGGRFFHCSSIGANKGDAIARVVDNYKEENQDQKIFTVALGDSENDIPMLNLVDFPFLVRKHDGTAIETGIGKVVITEGIGPAGFTEAVERVFL